MRTVSRGSPIDRRWSVPGMIVSRIRDGLASEDSPLTVKDVMSRSDYRDLMTPAVSEGGTAQDFELPTVDGSETVRLSSLLQERPVALVFGSYT
jgi:hypothetical protein